MKISNILMKPELVRASLDGLKTQTRRLRGLDEVNENPDDWEQIHWAPEIQEHIDNRVIAPAVVIFQHRKTGRLLGVKCPWGRAGDLVYVREPFGYEIRSVGGTPHEQIVYRASNPDAVRCYDCNGAAQPMKWRPSIHMPRWASRLTLRLKEVRVERLQDISDKDAIAEGLRTSRMAVSATESTTVYKVGLFFSKNPVSAFSALWEKINGPASWDANPWLWVLVYEPIAMNVDQVLKLEAA